ncbi:MAG: carbohydrate esterase [Bacteroidetes bacterium]|nr:carbohydrate esterase [Bacteroidota bacterium]
MEILIYVPKITSRINYTFRQLCKRMLGFEINFTTKIETFIAYKGVKFSYANQRLGNEIFIQAHGLLSEQGVNDVEITVSKWRDVPYFFKTSSQSDIPYDIFAASFFLLSRYEEYLPHVKDELGEFPTNESLAYKNNFLHLPVIDIWLTHFTGVLKEKFDTVQEKESQFNFNLIIAVERAFQFRKIGISRSIGGFLADVFQLKIRDLYARIKTWFKSSLDPFDVYDDLIDLKDQLNINMLFMFQLGDYSIHTKNINYRKRLYKKLIKSMGDYCEIGLLASHEGIEDIETLHKEIKRFENISNLELESILIKDRKLNFPDFYVNLEKTIIQKDYSMGYANHIGFRAGTCSSFLFYDLNLEQASPIKINPYFLSSKVLKRLNNKEVEQFINELKPYKVNLNLLFNNSDFAEEDEKKRYFQIFKQMI